MRQFQLDEEAGRETDSLEYSREFRNFWKAETDAATEQTGGELAACLEVRAYWRSKAIEARAERDAALAAIERVKETLSLHNPNGRLVKEVLAALDGAPEPEEVEWEYGVRNRLTWKVGFPYSREEVADRIDDENRRVAGTYYVMRFEAVRRRKAGPWIGVDDESH